MKKVILSVLLIAMFVNVGCEMTIPWRKQPTTNPFDVKIAELEAKHKVDIDVKVKEIAADQKKKDDLQQANLQQSAGLAYGIYVLNNTKATPTRVDSLIGFKSTELVKRLPSLASDDLLKINDELRKELDEKATTITDLQVKYNAALAQADKDKAAISEAQKVVEAKKADLESLNRATQEKLNELQNLRHEKDVILKDKALKEAEDAKNREETIKYLIRIFVGVGALLAIAAYIMKSITLGAASAASFGLGIFIAFVPPWVIIAGGSGIFIAIVAGFWMKYSSELKLHKEEKDFSNKLVGSIENFKEKVGADKFKQELGANLNDWFKDAPEKLEAKVKTKLKEIHLD